MRFRNPELVAEVGRLIREHGDVLDARDRYVLNAYFGIGRTPMTLRAIGERSVNRKHMQRDYLNQCDHKPYLSGERVRQLRDIAIRKLRKAAGQ